MTLPRLPHESRLPVPTPPIRPVEAPYLARSRDLGGCACDVWYGHTYHIDASPVDSSTYSRCMRVEGSYHIPTTYHNEERAA